MAHDDNAGSVVRHQTDVVSDEEIRHVGLALQLKHQVQYLRPDRHVEGGHRFVANHEAGTDTQGTSGRHSQQLSTRQGAKAKHETGGIDADAIEESAGLVPSLTP